MNIPTNTSIEHNDMNGASHWQDAITVDASRYTDESIMNGDVTLIYEKDCIGTERWYDVAGNLVKWKMTNKSWWTV